LNEEIKRLLEEIKGDKELVEEYVAMKREKARKRLRELLEIDKDVQEAKDLLKDAFVVIFHDNEVLLKASESWRNLKESGELIDDRDILIASVAITKGIPLMTS